MEIHRLEPSIVAKIKSSTTINSVTQCITELVLNSLDAKSTAVAVRVNFVTFRIQVVDNGDGITKENLNLIGERYMTNKCNDLSQLESHCPYYGFRGEALASIINVSEIIEIVSKTKDSMETWCRKFTKKAGSNTISAKDRPSCGTTVTVEGFLYNLPLRKNRVIPEMEFTQIKRNIECLLIIHPTVSFSLRNDVTGDLILNSPKCGDVISSFKYLHPELTNDYSLIKVSKSKVTVKALLFKQLWENSNLQYIYVNKRPIKCLKMQTFIYNVFRKNKKYANQMFCSKPNEKTKHYVFVISIKCPYSFIDVLLSPTKTVVEFKNWPLIFSCLEKLILSFLGANKKPCEKNYVKSNEVKSVCGISQIHGVFKGYGVKRKIDTDKIKSPPQKMQKLNDNHTEKVDNAGEVPECPVGNDELIERQISVPVEMKFPQFRNTQNCSLKNTNRISEFSCDYNRKNNKINKSNFLCRKGTDLQKHILPVNQLHPLPITVVHKNNIKNFAACQVQDTHSTLTKFTNDENKGKNLIMDMFLKSTQVFNSDDESQNLVVPKESNSFHKNKLMSCDYNGKNLIMDMFLKSAQVYSSVDGYQNITIQDCPDNFRENKLINDENNGKHLIMDMFLKSTQVNNWDDECQNDKSGDTIFEEESKYVLENNITTNVNGKSKTMSMSVNITRKIKKRCNLNKKHLNLSKSIQTSFQKNMVSQCVQTSVCQKRGASNIDKKSINAELAENYTLILSKSRDRAPKFKFVYRSPFNLPFSEYKEPASENNCKCNCHSHKMFDFNNYIGNKYVKPNSHNLKYDNIKNPISIKKQPLQKNTTVNKSFYFDTNFQKTVNKVESTKKYFNYCESRYTTPDNLKFMENVLQPEGNYLKINSPFNLNKTVNKNFYFSTNSYKTDNKAECTENNFQLNNTQLNVSVEVDRTYSYFNFNPQCQSTQINQFFSRDKDFQKCSSVFSKLNNQQNLIFPESPNEDHITSDISLFRDHYKNIQYTEVNKTKKKCIEEKNNTVSHHNPILKKTTKHETKMTSDPEEELFITLSNRQKQQILENELNTEKQFLDKINLEWASQMAACKENEEAKQNSNVCLDEWVKKQNEFGCDFYINTKTGFTTFYTPKATSNTFKFDKRFEFVPKGLSPILKEIKEVDMSLSQNKKDKLVNYILESYQNDLLTIKWQKYIENNDIKTFFDQMYREKLNSLENDIPSAQRNRKYFSELNNSVTFNKALFDNLTIIGQLDKKFIVALEDIKRLIILFDQHAVHERIRLEDLLKSYSNAKLASCRHKFIVFVPRNDLSLLKKHEDYLNYLGLHVEFFEDGVNIVEIPLCLHNKFKDNDGSLNTAIQLLIKDIIDLINDTRGVTFKNFPQIIQNLLNLEACRGAIKFGDALSKTDCEQLLKKLSTCNLPFQCAHGRPTLVPLLTLDLTNSSTPKTTNFKNLGV